MGKIVEFNKEKHLDDIMKIWLDSNNEAHDFLKEGYWENYFEQVKKLLPDSDLNIYIEDGVAVGFIGIVDNYIAGIFIKRKYRNKGIGKKLLEFAKNKYDALSLDVYEKNKNAYDFYLKNNFFIINKKIDKETGETEITMKWQK